MSLNFLKVTLFIVLIFDVSVGVVVGEKNEDPSPRSYPLDCTVRAQSHHKCIALEGCSWCRASGLPGICASEEQVKVLIHEIPHVKCTSEETLSTTTDTQTTNKSTGTSLLRGPPKLLEEIHNQETVPTTTAAAWAPYDPKCLNAPSEAGTDDDDAEEICNQTTDSQGEMCVWCDAAGVFNLCLSSEQAEAASSYLQCDLSQSSSMSAV